VNRSRITSGFSYLSPIRSVFLTTEAIQKRIHWCQERLNEGTDWTRIVFSDESIFELSDNCKRLWRRPGEVGDDVRAHKKAHPQKLMIWGAVVHNFKSSLVFFDGNVDSAVYIDNVIKNSGFIEDANRAFGDCWIFQQDNARPHVAKATIAELVDKNITLLRDWPPYSPDLNIIENLWAIMKFRVQKQSPKNLLDLRKIIEGVWDNLSYETIEKLLDSMYRRCQEVLQNNGLTIAN
jgi:hypothetical protein